MISLIYDKNLEDIPLKELSELLKHYEGIYKSEIVNQRPTIDEDKLIISTSGVSAGSAVTCIRSNEPEELEKAHTKIVKSFQDNSLSALSPQTREKIISLKEFCKKKNKIVYFDKKADVKVSPISEFLHVKQISGETTIHGELVSIGNQRPTAKVLCSEGYTVRCIFPSREFAKKISSKLYEIISIKGKGTWNTDTWNLEELIVSEVLDFKGLDNLSNLSSLSQLWQGGSPEEFMETIR